MRGPLGPLGAVGARARLVPAAVTPRVRQLAHHSVAFLHKHYFKLPVHWRYYFQIKLINDLNFIKKTGDGARRDAGKQRRN